MDQQRRARKASLFRTEGRPIFFLEGSIFPVKEILFISSYNKKMDVKKKSEKERLFSATEKRSFLKK